MTTEKKLNLFLGIATLALLVALGVAIFGVRTVIVNNPVGSSNPNTTNFDALTLDNGDLNVASGTISTTLGAGGGAGTSTRALLSQNGSETYMLRCASFQQGTTTLCAVQNGNATSTLIQGQVQVTAATNTDIFIDIAEDTTAFATGTLIGTTFSWSASDATPDDQDPNIIASTSPIAAQNITIAPNAWIVVKVASKNNDGATAHAGFALTGSANFELRANK